MGGGGQGSGARLPDGRGGGKKGKRRRQRQQRPRHARKPTAKENAAIDSSNRERIFQHVEGLLRQIREEAEETGKFSEDQVRDYAMTVVNFNRLLEEQSEPLPERVRIEYLRVRDKLTSALNN